jgi:2-succinyl-6-hydroxy-2,4-cyclohexadiene-1-carboxylate synthase
MGNAVMPATALHIYDGAPESDRPVLLMLHGFMGSGQLFKPFFDSLSQVVRPIAIDLVGHGASEKPVDPKAYETAGQVNRLAEVISDLKLHQKEWYLYGYSMGGRLALQYICAEVPLPSALILESTHTGLQDPYEREERQLLDEQRAQSIEQDFDAFLAKWEQADLFHASSLARNEIHHVYRQVQASQRPECMAASLRGFGAGVMPSVQHAIRKWTRPTLILCGSDDAKYRDRTRTLTKAMPEAKVDHIEIPGAAHRVHVDQPKEFIHQLITFIRSHRD